jgi:hypothetical protein
MKDWQITLQQYLKDNKHKLSKGELKLYKSLTARKRVWGDSKGFRLWESGEDKLIKALSKEISEAINKDIIKILMNAS